MLRGLIILILISGAVLFALPFLVSSLYLDQRGVTIPGRVYSKREDVTVLYSTWKHSSEVTIEYFPPDTASPSFLTVPLPPERYDGFRKGQPVSLHYLPRKDVPHLPMAKFLSEVHALPTARLAGEAAFSRWEAFFTRTTVIICGAIAAMVLLLFLWRRSGLGGFAWAVGVCVLSGAAGMLIIDFPTPLPGPKVDVRKGSGTVKSLGQIDRLFEESHQRGLEAGQIVEVVGVEFVPAGRTEPVLAVDLIDAGSLSGLQQDMPVGIEYEAGSPRTAHIQNATRNFVGRNIRGIALQGVLSLLVLAVFLVGAHYLGRGYDRLLHRGR